jgi:hypothetical protein
MKQIKRNSGYLVWLSRWRETDPAILNFFRKNRVHLSL